MHFVKNLNAVRRRVMRKMTRGLATTRIPASGALSTPQKIQRVLICRPNHRLGNLLLITPLLQEVEETLPNAKVDLFLKGTIAPVLFRNYRSVNRIIQLPKKPLKNIIRYLRGWVTIRRNRYDLVINVVHDSSSGRMSAQFANAKIRFMGDFDDGVRSHYIDYRHISKGPVYSFRHYIRQLGITARTDSLPELDLKLSADEIQEGGALLREIVMNDKPTIAIYTYATGSKCYSREWWLDFYARLAVGYPGYNIIEVLPIENVSQIGFTAPTFYSRDVRKIASLIRNTDVFIGADSGMMHLASAAHAPTIGLFKYDNMPMYAPFNKNSAGVNTADAGTDAVFTILNRILSH